MTRWWVGAYGPDMHGTAEGIGMLGSRDDGSLQWLGLAAHTPSPTFLLRSAGRLCAAEEGSGSVVSFDVDGTDLTFAARVPSGGTGPCQIAEVDELLVVANYLDGAIGVIGGDDLLQVIAPQPGSGPKPEQDGPHAHAAFRLDATTLVTLDLGADRLDLHEVAGRDVIPLGSVTVAAGTGPRDIARHASGHLYVLGELGGTVLVVTWVGAVASVVASVDIPGAEPGDHAAALGFGPNGFVYTGLRGSNRIGVLRASEDGATLEPIGWVSCEGDWPRHLVVDGDLLHVANQQSNTIATFRLGDDGMPALVATTPAPSPTYLLAVE